MGSSMSTPSVKIRLRSGSREIEIEASRQDVDELLATWWTAHTPASEIQGDNISEAANEGMDLGPDSSSKKRKIKKRSLANKTNGSTQSAPEFDYNALANRIKHHPQFEAVRKKIIHNQNDLDKRAAFVISQSDVPMHSGQVKKVFEALRVKVNAPRLSEALSKNNSSYITSPGPRSGWTLYEITARAREEVDRWLLEDNE